MKGVTRILCVCLLTIIIISAVVIIGCTSEPASTTDTVTANQTTTTKKTPTPTTITPTTTTTTPTTSTTTTTTTTPPTITTEPTAYQILDLIVPESGVEGVWNVSVVMTNNGNSQLSFDIPIKLFQADDLANFRTYVISVILDKDETKEFTSEGIYVPSGSYIVEVSDIIKSIEVG